MGNLSSVGRASALQAEGHRFEPYSFHQMREWLSGRASPCQGERREFESRLPLHNIVTGLLACAYNVDGMAP